MFSKGKGRNALCRPEWAPAVDSDVHQTLDHRGHGAGHRAAFSPGPLCGVTRGPIVLAKKLHERPPVGCRTCLPTLDHASGRCSADLEPVVRDELASIQSVTDRRPPATVRPTGG